MRIAHGLFGLSFLAAGLPASADIYRCTGAAGESAYSQQPCTGGSAVMRLAPVGSAPSSGGLRPAERAWLQSRERQKQGRNAKRTAPRKHDTAVKRRRALAASQADRQAYRCLRKRRALDAVKAKLRRGYKPSQGENLRRRRRAHTDYLDQFCS